MSWYLLTDGESDRFNPPPVEIVEDAETGESFVSLLDDPLWLHVGYIPMPRTRLSWFVYHLIHGVVMRYPIHKVIGYSFASLFHKANLT